VNSCSFLHLAKNRFYLTLLSVCLLLSFPLKADESKIHFILPKQSLEDSISQMAIQAGIQVLFRSDSMLGLQAEAVNDKLTVKELLDKLLENTALEYHFLNNIVVISVKQTDGVAAINTEMVPAATKVIDPVFYAEEVLVVGEIRDFGCCRNSPSTATKTFVPTIEVPQSLEGISSELLHDRGNTTLTEAFRDYSSVNVINHRGDVNLRGFLLNDRSIMKDGLPVVSHGIASPILQNYEGVEIAKGINSALYGHGAPAGAINLLSKKPTQNRFTTVDLDYGNQDGFIGVDYNDRPWANENLLQRTNLLMRRERDNDRIDGEINYYLFAPALRYNFEDGSILSLGFEYNQQSVQRNRGMRPAERTADGFQQSVFYGPNSEIDDSPFYPVSGFDSEDAQKSTVIDFSTAFETALQGGWILRSQTYFGVHDAHKEFFSDFNMLTSATLDPQPFTYLPNGLTIPTRLGIPAIVDKINNAQSNTQANQNSYDVFKQTTGLTLEQIVTPGVIDFPYWSDNKVHFSTAFIDETVDANQFEFDLNFNRESELFNLSHNLLFGVSFHRRAEETALDMLYNAEVFQQGTEIVNASSDPAEEAVGYALRRYAAIAAYYPYGPELPPGIVLPDKVATAAGRNPALRYAYDASVPVITNDNTTTSLGFYLQDQIDFDAQWKLRLASGLYRYRSIDKNRELNAWGVMAGEYFPMLSSSEANNTVLSPSVGVVYLPKSNLSLFISYGKQFDIIDGVNSNHKSFGPEKTQAYEVGTKWWLFDDTDFHLNASLFQMTVDNWLLGDSENIRFKSQEGRFRSTGGEISLSGFVSPHWKIATAYTKTHPSVLIGNDSIKADDAVVFSTTALPKNTGNLWLQYYWTPFGKAGWSIGGGMTYMSKRNDNVFEYIVELPSYSLFDFALTYSNKDFNIAFNIDNLSDKDWLQGDSSTPEIRYSARKIYEGNGRRLRFGTEFLF